MEGLAQVLRQVWVRLSDEIARVRGFKLTQWVSDFPLAMLLEWLKSVRVDKAAEREIPLGERVRSLKLS